MKASDVIGLVAQADGTNAKIDALRSVFNMRPYMKDLFYYADSPRLIYGIKGQKPVESDSDTSLDGVKVDEFLSILDRLANRDVTGNAARALVSNFLETIHPLDQVICCNVINKDMRLGLGAKNINKACPGLIELPPPYMRCSLMANSNYDKFKEFFYSQEKMDGMFLNMHINKLGVETITRSGEVFPINKFVNFVNAIKQHSNEFADFWLTGEIVLSKNGVMLDRKTSNGVCNSIMKNGSADIDQYEINFYAWDIIPDDKFVNGSEYEIAYKIRMSILENYINDVKLDNLKLVESRIVDREGATAHYKEIRQRGGEGTVIKDMDAPWEDGTSKNCIKMKAEVQIDMRIKSLNPGKGKRADTFGSIAIESECGQVVGNISGMDDATLLEIFNNFDSKYKDAIVTVTSNELISSKNRDTLSLFLPRWDEIRFDKNVADDLTRIKEIFESTL